MDEPSEASETTVEALAPEFNRHGSPIDSNDGCSHENKTAVNPRQILGALEIVERDSVAIAESFNSLFASLRLALSEVTGTSVEHMHCFLDAAGHLQESGEENYCSVIELFLNSKKNPNFHYRLNQEMKGFENLAMQLKILKRSVDALDSSINQNLRFS